MKKLMIVCVLVALAMAVLDATHCERIEPDGLYPMAIQHITCMHEKTPDEQGWQSKG